MTEIIKYELDQDGIALLTIDLPGKSMNIISAQLLDELQGEGLQSDRRFAESYAHMRINKGYGPQRIDNELRERGVSESIRRATLRALADSGEVDWWALMQQVREKKFGNTLPEDYASRSKQMRFLQYRGFASEAIRELFS